MLANVVPVSSYPLRVNILIVDPNAFMRTIFCSILRLFGAHRIREASDGKTAFEELRLFAPDLIITEYAMAPVNGVKFVHALRRGKFNSNPTIPIIMATAYSEAEHVVAARDEGVNEFVFKPLSANSLMTHVLRVAENPRPFVKAANYLGPDRRRTQQPLGGPDRRKESPADRDRTDASDR